MRLLFIVYPSEGKGARHNNFQTARRRLIHGLDIKAGGIVFEPGTKKMAAKNSNLVAQQQQHHDTASRIQLQRTEKGYFPIFCSNFETASKYNNSFKKTGQYFIKRKTGIGYPE